MQTKDPGLARIFLISWGCESSSKINYSSDGSLNCFYRLADFCDFLQRLWIEVGFLKGIQLFNGLDQVVLKGLDRLSTHLLR
jgi:hypothetical protein